MRKIRITLQDFDYGEMYGTYTTINGHEFHCVNEDIETILENIFKHLSIKGKVTHPMEDVVIDDKILRSEVVVNDHKFNIFESDQYSRVAVIEKILSELGYNADVCEKKKIENWK